MYFAALQHAVAGFVAKLAVNIVLTKAVQIAMVVVQVNEGAIRILWRPRHRDGTVVAHNSARRIVNIYLANVNRIWYLRIAPHAAEWPSGLGIEIARFIVTVASGRRPNISAFGLFGTGGPLAHHLLQQRVHGAMEFRAGWRRGETGGGHTSEAQGPS